MDSAVRQELGMLKNQHRCFGLMIDEIEAACFSMEGDQLVNAIDEITIRYNITMR